MAISTKIDKNLWSKLGSKTELETWYEVTITNVLTRSTMVR